MFIGKSNQDVAIPKADLEVKTEVIYTQLFLFKSNQVETAVDSIFQKIANRANKWNVPATERR